MENSGEMVSVSETIIKTPENRQANLARQLETLDMNRPGHKALGDFLTKLYSNYDFLDDSFSKKDNIRYQPKCALKGVNTVGSLSSTWGIYDYEPIAVAADKVVDNFNIFPAIEAVFKKSIGKSNSEIINELAKTVTEKTEVPVVIETPDNNVSNKNWAITESGLIYSKSISDRIVGLHTHAYKGTSEMVQILNQQGYIEDMDFTPAGDVIIINKNSVDNNEMQAVQTCLHELGHIVEDQFIMPQKEIEAGDKPVLNTEIIAALYGLKTCFLMIENNPAITNDEVVDMMISPVCNYNWSLTGTVAP